MCILHFVARLRSLLCRSFFCLYSCFRTRIKQNVNCCNSDLKRNSSDYDIEYDSTWEDEDDTETSEIKISMHWTQSARRNIYAAQDMQNFRHRLKATTSDDGSSPDEEQDTDRDLPNVMFYRNKKPSQPDGMRIEDYHGEWSRDYTNMERNHVYIQWLFPIQEQGMNSYAYPLSQREIKRFHEDADMKQTLQKSYKLMLNFYGIKLVDEKSGIVERSGDWEMQSKNLNRNTHNNLRITRILKCLGTLGFQHYQAPLVQFFLEETLVNWTLPRVKSSALDYFMFAVLNLLERKKLIKFAFVKFEPKEEFVWCPKRIQRKFLNQKKDHEVPGNSTSESNPAINPQNQTPQSNPTINLHNQTPQSNPAINPLNQTPESNPTINPQHQTTQSNSAIKPLNQTPESNPNINPQNQTPESNPTINPLNQTPKSNPAINPQNQIPVSASGINSEIAKASWPESETQPAHEASESVSSSRGSEENGEDELQSVTDLNSSNNMDQMSCGGPGANASVCFQDDIKTIEHPENVASAIPSEEKLSAQAECDIPTPHDAKGDSRCKTVVTQTSGSEDTETDVPVLQQTTAQSQHSTEQSTAENKNTDLSGEDRDVSGKGMCNDQPASENVEVTAENSSKCDSGSNGGNKEKGNKQPELNPPVGYQMARGKAKKSGTDKEGYSVSVLTDHNHPTTTEDGSTQFNITDNRCVPASGYSLSHDNNAYSDQTVVCEKERDVPDELKEGWEKQHSDNISSADMSDVTDDGKASLGDSGMERHTGNEQTN